MWNILKFKPVKRTGFWTIVQGCLFAIAALISVMTIMTTRSNLANRMMLTDTSHDPGPAEATCVFDSLETARTRPLLRAVVAYFSVSQTAVYFDQLKWCMRSLLEIATTEPALWRTDLIIYIENVTIPDLLDLGCSTTPRQNASEPFKCLLVEYERVQDRVLSANATEYERNLHEQMKEYPFIDSIYALVEHASTYSNYDYVVRSDLDVFFPPAFSHWIPPNCAFVTGNGAYSDPYNMEKLAMVANYSGIHFNTTIWNIGSTWIGSPHLIAKVAARTVHWMIHLSKNEFAPKQRTSAWWSMALLWPEWHYGVVLLYGGHLAVNEVLQSGKQHPFLKLDLDHPTTSTANCTLNGPIHLHTYQNHDYFSKYVFSSRLYNETYSLPSVLNSTRCCDYAGYMAADSLNMTCAELKTRLRTAKLS
ncbi:hypothetical protein RvY_12352 [Ramazzottius varieornatus]|uniref:DUF7164 domain-containing protein n=1 Tax=Ramazzottius varieornatus TaxID=947166 RepID=A0A1D1VPM7_RAMVA|nr:hypothetical protein RvY_12352 [Ramazzottius varieornatus]